MKIILRLKQYIDYKGISLNAFDKSIEAANGYIGKQIKNEGSIGVDIIQKIISVYNDLDLEWLITGVGTMLKSDIAEPIVKQEEPQSKSNCVEIIEQKDKMIKLLEDQVLFLKKQLDVCQNDKMFLQKNFQSVKKTYD